MQKSKEYIHDVNLILKRVKNKLNIKKDKELAQMLSVTSSSYSNWKSRNTLDYKLILELCHKSRLDLNEIFFDMENPNYEYANRYHLIVDSIKEGITDQFIDQINQLKKANALILNKLEKEETRRKILEAKAALLQNPEGTQNEPLDDLHITEEVEVGVITTPQPKVKRGRKPKAKSTTDTKKTTKRGRKPRTTNLTNTKNTKNTGKTNKK